MCSPMRDWNAAARSRVERLTLSELVERAKLDRVTTIDVAPTIARLLGVPLPSAKGKVLTLQ